MEGDVRPTEAANMSITAVAIDDVPVENLNSMQVERSQGAGRMKGDRSQPRQLRTSTKLELSRNPKDQMKFQRFLDTYKNDMDKSTQAAQTLQRHALNALRKHCLDREKLVMRLKLEAVMARSICMMITYFLVFILMCIVDEVGTPKGQLHLEDFYVHKFGLKDLSSEVNTLDEWKNFLSGLTEITRELTPTSDLYFKDKEEVKVTEEVKEYSHREMIELDDLRIRVDQLEFSFTAWVNADAAAEGYIIRKPLAISGHAYVDNCWGWYHASQSKFFFGAHDFGGLHTAEEQEMAQVPPENAVHIGGGKDNTHLETVVVRQHSIEFWINDVKTATVPINRPVTDCSGNAYEVGDAGLTLAMIIFYPFALRSHEIHEIFEFGTTLKHMQEGMKHHHPKVSEFDRLAEQLRVQKAQSESDGMRGIFWIEMAHVLTREVTEEAAGHHEEHTVHARIEEEVEDCVHSPACRFITGVGTEPTLVDELTNQTYFDLLPPSLGHRRRRSPTYSTYFPHRRRRGAPGERYHIHLEKDRHAYTSTDFPAEVGSEFSISFWAKPLVAGGFLLGKFMDTTHDYPCWAVYLTSDQIELHTMEEDHKVVLSRVRLDSSRNLNNYAMTEGVMMRHYLLTVSESKRHIRLYLDGELVGEDHWKYSKVTTLSCDSIVVPSQGSSHSSSRLLADSSSASSSSPSPSPSSDTPYIAFMHRTPGSQDMLGDFQQFRLYPNVELSAKDAHSLNDYSVDPHTGAILRECGYPGEAYDDPLFKDEQGHSCKWYATAQHTIPSICIAPKIKQACPVACRSILPCYRPLPPTPEIDIVWKRVMHVMPPDTSEDASHRRLSRHGRPRRSKRSKIEMPGAFTEDASQRRLAGSSNPFSSGRQRNWAVCMAQHVPDSALETAAAHGSSCSSGASSSTSGSHGSSSGSDGHRRLASDSHGSSSGADSHSVSQGGHPEPPVPMVETDHTAVIERCKRLKAEGHHDYNLSEYDRSHLKVSDGYLYLQDHYPESFLDATDCDKLDAQIDDYCAFNVSMHNWWTTHFDNDIACSGQFTLTFWLRPYGPGASLSGGQFLPTVQFFSELAPPDVFFSLFVLTGHSPRVEAYLHTHEKSGGHGIEVGATLSTTDWTHISLAFGNRDAKGHQEVTLMVNAYYMTDYMPTKWVKSHSGLFLQAMVFSPDMLVSPVEFQSTAVSVEDLQLHYYEESERMELRRGPLSKEHDRLHHRIEYELAPFQQPGFVAAPPLALQYRYAVTPTCPHEAGTYAVNEMWRKIVTGAKCGWPFDCGLSIMTEPTSIMGCVDSGIQPEFHFGQTSMKGEAGHLEGLKVFAEFVPTVADTPFVVRQADISDADINRIEAEVVPSFDDEDLHRRLAGGGGEDGGIPLSYVPYDTVEYFDQMTQEVSVDVSMISPQLGIITQLEITANMKDAKVVSDYQISHFASLDNSRIQWMMILAGITIVCALIILADAIVRIYRVVNRDKFESKARICLDVVISFYTIIFYAIRASKTNSSMDDAKSVVRDMMAVPWESPDKSFHDKEKEFFEVLRELQELISFENDMRIVFFVLLVLTIMRIVDLLSTHPRVAMMTDTLYRAKDELWQLVILFTFLLVGFSLIGKALFGQKLHEFADLAQTLKTLYEVAIGEVPEFWSTDPKITFFFLLFQFTMFFLLLNFLLAIIMDTFSAVKEELGSSVVDQEFFIDISSVISATIKRMIYGWPRTVDIIDGLEKMYGLKYVNVDRLGDEWDYFGKKGMDWSSSLRKKSEVSWSRKSRLSFARHYGNRVGWGVLMYERGSGEPEAAGIDRKMEKLLQDSKYMKKSFAKLQDTLDKTHEALIRSTTI